MESDLTALLQAICPRVSPDVADFRTARPYITWQLIGGRSLRWLDTTASDKRHAEVQINVWADTRLAALTMIRQIENAMCASTAFKAWPDGESISDAEEDLSPPLYGSLQRFNVYSTR